HAIYCFPGLLLLIASALEDGSRYQVESIKKHERYTSKLIYHDIAILKLNQRITFTERIRPVCLPKPSFVKQNFGGRTVVVTGWGKMFYSGFNYTFQLLQYCLKPFGRKQCHDSYMSLKGKELPRGITDDLICAGLPHGKKNTCKGDSGGPLVIEENGRWILLGVVPFGYRVCAEPGFPGVYTKVTNYLEWIAANSDLGK
ncbi:clotting factor B-like, partial [Tachypleus tridentatus]|uniref:clotting factor B-like n=1 Tax=Tachypleus tridentatus TaxID=6853 RepID=UPI003FD51D81